MTLPTLKNFFNTNSSVPTETSFEQDLIDLKKYGRPKITCMDDGSWYCSISMHVSSKGASFDVASDFKQRTPSEALAQCRARIIETLSKYGVQQT